MAHPTDTSWHISCTFSSAAGMAKLKNPKDGGRGHTFTLIASRISQVSHVADITTPQYKMIHRLAPGPYVFILEALRKLEKITGIDMILDGGKPLSKTLTTVLDLTGEEVEVIRQGIGPF